MEGPSVHALADELQFLVGQKIERAGVENNTLH